MVVSSDHILVGAVSSKLVVANDYVIADQHDEGIVFIWY